MKPLLLNTSDISGGAARAAFRLHKGLHSIGVNSNMLVGQKDSDDAGVIGPLSKIGKGFSIIRPTLDSLPLMLYPKRTCTIFSPSVLPDGLSKRMPSQEADIINLHWVAEGFLRIETLLKFRKSIVWTLHDMWAFTGGCHYDEGCGRYKEECGNCPLLGSKRQNDLSHKIWKRKKRSWMELDITIVTPSRWLAECAKTSSLFEDRRIEVIPYGLNLDIYKPMEKNLARERFGLPQDKKLILFGAMSASSDKRKGFQFLEPALKKLSQDNRECELVIFGTSKPEKPPNLGLKLHYIGQLHDDVSLAMLYAAADLFVAPSVQDNLPNTVMESISCGTPVVAFNIGGMPDMVEHKKNGYLAKPFDTEGLARGISWVLEDDNRVEMLGKAAREKAVREYALEIQARCYLALYEELIEEHKSRNSV